MSRAFVSIFAVAILATPNDVASAQDGPVMKRLAETKTISIGHRDASVPLSYLGPDGKVQGYSIDICLKIVDAAKEELKLDKLEVKFVPLTPQNPHSAPDGRYRRHDLRDFDPPDRRLDR